MKMHLLTIGSRMPEWVNTGYQEYAKRLPRECSLQLLEIPLGTRSKNCDIPRLIQREGEQMLAAIPENNIVVTLEIKGESWSTEKLSEKLKQWMSLGQDISLLIGGPEGLAPACRLRSQTQWSISNLTLPHPLVRIIVAEQLYRAWTLLKNHPYHRG